MTITADNKKKQNKFEMERSSFQKIKINCNICGLKFELVLKQHVK